MTGKVIVIIIVILLGIIVILPFVLNIFGVNVLQFGSLGGTEVAENAVVARSLDGGKSWENVSLSETPRTAFPSQILRLTLHPTDPAVVFLGSKSSGLWKSGNGGASWVKMTDQAGGLDPKSDVYDIAISTARPETMYLAVYQQNRGRVLRSDDGGQSFREIYFVTSDRFVVFDLNLDAFDSNHVFLVSGQGGVLETTNGGRTWKVVKWFTEAVEEILVNPVNPKEMLVVTANDVLFKSVDGGANWAPLKVEERLAPETIPTIPAPQINPFGLGRRDVIRALVADPNSFNTLYVGSTDGLFRSKDGGFNWARLKVLIPPEALPVEAVAVHPNFPSVIFAGAGIQLHRTEDGGANWSFQDLPTRYRVQSLHIQPLNPQIMFATFGR